MFQRIGSFLDDRKENLKKYENSNLLILWFVEIIFVQDESIGQDIS